MRLVVQRVRRAAVGVAGEEVAEIGQGCLILLGVGKNDTPEVCRELAAKLVNLRIFADDSGKTNLSLLEVGGSALVVSQFTLYADTRKGRRPSFTDAAPPDLAADLVEQFAAFLRDAGVETRMGRFGADMQVSLVNDGPFTIILENQAKTVSDG